ncbi:MAG: hypothetical protein LBE83_08475 [Propionibacteriaceae bacterium]|jgi:hypothetical protein|nr:hypothetical protein [Propionibacteriaceae bacterium]
MSQFHPPAPKKSLDALSKNQIIGGICAGFVVLFASMRIFVVRASADALYASLATIASAALSLVVLTSAVRIMLIAKRTPRFESVLLEMLDDIDLKYGALIESLEQEPGGPLVYGIADNVDAIFTFDSSQWGSLHYSEKFALSPNFKETRTLYYYIDHDDMESRSARLGDDLETTARLLARDTAVTVQRSFPDVITAHALDITPEPGRAMVTVLFNSAETATDAEDIAEVIDYLLFLHFIAT